MNDIQRAKQYLEGHTLCVCKAESVIVSDKRGIYPMVDIICSETDVSGWSAADIIVGKAAAMLFVYAGIDEVYGRVLSREGARVLEQYNVPYTCATLADYIINRSGDDICPMEKLVKNIESPKMAFAVLKNALKTW